MNRRGFTLTELLVTMAVMAILGVALARIIINNSRFVGQQDAMMEAREAARAAMNTMTPELRMISDGGLVAASAESVTARVPYAFGMMCPYVPGSPRTASLMPTDSVTYASAVPGGLAWRTSAGTYSSPITGITVTAALSSVVCTADSIRLVPAGRFIDISGIPSSQQPDSGSIFYLFQTVTYKFAPSADLPGRIGLWRRAGSAGYEELVAPFDPAARFAFLMGVNMQVDTRTNVAAAALDSVRGLELRLVGASDYVPQGESGYTTFDLRTNVAFLNKAN